MHRLRLGLPLGSCAGQWHKCSVLPREIQQWLRVTNLSALHEPDNNRMVATDKDFVRHAFDLGERTRDQGYLQRTAFFDRCFCGFIEPLVAHS